MFQKRILRPGERTPIDRRLGKLFVGLGAVILVIWSWVRFANLRVEGADSGGEILPLLTRAEQIREASPRAFLILLRGPQGIQPVKGEVWWTLLGTILGLVIGGATWGLALRQRVSKQTALIRQKLEQEALLEQMREQSALLELAQDAIFVRDMDGQLHYWNKSAERLYGWTAAEASHEKITRFLYRQPSTLEETKKALLEKGQWNGEMRQLTKSGREIIVSSRWTLLRDEQNKPKSILVINTDITEKKRLEAQFLHTQRMESIGTLASGIAHDLNNLLAPMLMAIQLLRLRKLDKKSQELLASLEGNTERGSAIIKQVLTFARKIDGERAQVQPKNLIVEIVKICSGTFPKSIAISSQIPSELWTVTGDPTQLHQVLLNLCVNARDAMPEGGTLLVKADNYLLDQSAGSMPPDAKPGPYVVFEISDTGTGIPPEIMHKIFDPFFTTKENGKGTGLGLSTVVGIAKAHGGFVKVHSELNKGSWFKVFLPAMPNTDTVETKQRQLSLPEGKGELIILADDEPSVRDVTRSILAHHNYQVLTARNGAEALGLFAQNLNAVKLVVTDIMMPLMDGLALARALKKMRPEINIIASSGLAGGPGQAYKEQEFRELGVSVFLSKPYRTEKLLAAIHEALNSQNSFARAEAQAQEN